LLILAYVKNMVVPVLASPIESHIIQNPMQLYAGCLIFVIYALLMEIQQYYSEAVLFSIYL